LSAGGSVQVLHIGKAFPGVQALQDVSLSLQPGRIHALVGENGAGKSTLINILTGVLAPDTGEIRIGDVPVHFADARAARRHGIAVVHQEVDLFPDLSVAEIIGLEQGLPRRRLGTVSWPEVRRRARHALGLVGEALTPGAAAGGLSPAQRQLLLIAAAVAEQARVLVLDEPTSSLSAAEAAVLFDHLRRFRAAGTAILYVSHRLEEIGLLADEVTVLRDGRHVWTGAASETDRGRLIELMVGHRDKETGRQGDKETSYSPRSLSPCLPVSLSSPPVFACRHLTAADGSFTDVTLEVGGGEVVGLYGLVGAGRSEWAQAVFGLRPVAGGEVLLDGQAVTVRGPGAMARAGVAYVPEDRLRQGLCRGLSVTANVVLAALRRLARGPWVSHREEQRRTRAAVARLGVRLHSLGQTAGTLSGGSQQKVVLGRWLGCEPRVLLLDEPTRGVDVAAKEEIHALVRGLAREGRAVIFISSDLSEVLAQSQRVGVFRQGRLVAFFDPATVAAPEVAAAALPQAKDEGRKTKDEGRRTKVEGRSTGQPSAATLLTPRPAPRAPSRELALVGLLLLLLALLQWHRGEVLSAATLGTIAGDAALLAFPALGAALVILAGGIDISLGALMALSAGVSAVLWQAGWPAPLALAAAALTGAVGGLLNAGLALAGRVHPIVITLGTLSLFRGLAGQVIGGVIQIPGSQRAWLFTDELGMPVLVLFGGGLAVVVWLLLTHTVAGRELYAVGGNPAAALRVGIHRGRVWLKAFALQGLLVGVAGFLALCRLGAVQDTDFDGVTLAAIAAGVVGGVAIAGGRGSAWGVVLGCLFLAALDQASVLLGVATTWQRTLTGSVLVLAVTLDTLWRRGGR
jgi:ABC-type sugar transport system ATPase subunit/ribose/xylose/arabinose/galactoside ABC-type transport system permease subunit